MKIDRFVRKTDGATEDEIDKFARHALSEEELIRLSKMTQEERDREDCQRFNAVWESKFKKPFKDSALDRSPQHQIS